MAHLDLIALIVEDYDTAIDLFVRVLQFELIEDSAPRTEPFGKVAVLADNRWDLLGPRSDHAEF